MNLVFKHQNLQIFGLKLNEIWGNFQLLKVSETLDYFFWRFNPYNAWIDFSRQNLTSVDVRFWRRKSITAL